MLEQNHLRWFILQCTYRYYRPYLFVLWNVFQTFRVIIIWPFDILEQNQSQRITDHHWLDRSHSRKMGTAADQMAPPRIPEWRTLASNQTKICLYPNTLLRFYHGVPTRDSSLHHGGTSWILRPILRPVLAKTTFKLHEEQPPWDVYNRKYRK